MEKKTGKENINPNVVNEATHMPESGLVSWGKVSTFGQILLFWTPLWDQILWLRNVAPACYTSIFICNIANGSILIF